MYVDDRRRFSGGGCPSSKAGAYVVAWIFRPNVNGATTTPPTPTPVSINIVRVGADGSVLDPAPSVIAQQSSSDSPALAATGSEVLAIWNGDCLRGATLHNDGTLLAAARTLACTPTTYDVDLAWKGGEFVAVWEDSTSGTIDALRLDAAMNPSTTRRSRSVRPARAPRRQPSPPARPQRASPTPAVSELSTERNRTM